MTSAPMEMLMAPAATPPVGIAAATPTGGSCVDPLAFAALVERAVAAGSGKTQIAAPTRDLANGPGAGTEPGTEGETAAPAPVEISLLALLMALPGTTIAPPTTGTPAAASAAAATGTLADPASTTGIPTTSAETPATATPATATPGTGTSTGSSPDPSPDPASGSTVGSAPRPDPTGSNAPPAAQHKAAEGRPVDPGTVPVVATGPLTVTGTPGLTGTDDAPPARAVAAQVIPEITRLVSNGEGVHRVTLQLNPRALGEVRVVLTMRQGEVHVRIAGGEEARQAVAASSADLTRALHHVGIEEHRLTLTDLSATAATRGGTGSDLHDQTRHHQHSTGGHDPDPHGQNSHSRMGDARSATDGSSTSNPTERTRGSARVHEASHTRPAGAVDLRM